MTPEEFWLVHKAYSDANDPNPSYVANDPMTREELAMLMTKYPDDPKPEE